eukprot:CAMPEP_0202483484 /NCGR_PEP_ID=MMETSP1361-20130828/2722_1 /ASSEMBLY_ACC=CAM_ASM_000849 /TAXON_ID=210615 /ORGANISM="Staurosira complex sp., Strain CCMP2646" /LENGTH=453 /DNA_ID=CAMNT_0049111769 /DNA_START=90 /DNA_END=1452 /DNA_ORIENTATION=+
MNEFYNLWKNLLEDDDSLTEGASTWSSATRTLDSFFVRTADDDTGTAQDDAIPKKTSTMVPWKWGRKKAPQPRSNTRILLATTEDAPNNADDGHKIATAELTRPLSRYHQSTNILASRSVEVEAIRKPRPSLSAKPRKKSRSLEDKMIEVDESDAVSVLTAPSDMFLRLTEESKPKINRSSERSISSVSIMGAKSQKNAGWRSLSRPMSSTKRAVSVRNAHPRGHGSHRNPDYPKRISKSIPPRQKTQVHRSLVRDDHLRSSRKNWHSSTLNTPRRDASAGMPRSSTRRRLEPHAKDYMHSRLNSQIERRDTSVGIRTGISARSRPLRHGNLYTHPRRNLHIEHSDSSAGVPEVRSRPVPHSSGYRYVSESRAQDPTTAVIPRVREQLHKVYTYMDSNMKCLHRSPSNREPDLPQVACLQQDARKKLARVLSIHAVIPYLPNKEVGQLPEEGM